MLLDHMASIPYCRCGRFKLIYYVFIYNIILEDHALF